MKLIFALGNPETQYDHTRHNVGFALLDAYVKEQGGTWQHKDKFKAAIAELTPAGEKILFAKPATYYNQVGESARAIADFYKLAPADILIIHDDLALPLGSIRTRVGGSDAGNNGMKSLNAHIGPETSRIRIGIWTEQAVRSASDFVLTKFSLPEQQIVSHLYNPVKVGIDNFINGSFKPTTYGVSENPSNVA